MLFFPFLRVLPLATLLLLPPLPAQAWNAAGHRLVACIAWADLDQHTRDELAKLLREHPDHTAWDKRAGDDDSGRAAFIEASTWPDEIRTDRRFFSVGVDNPTPTLPGFPDMERHRNWHYVNRPLGNAPRDHSQTVVRTELASGLIDKQLLALATTLGSPNASDGARVYALPWVIHLTGDAHQPLHTSIRADTEGQWDKPGKAMSVINPYSPRHRSSTLHAFWDDLPGPPWLRGERLDTACRALASQYPRPAPSTADQWLAESWQIAQDAAYPQGDDKEPAMSAEFYENAKEIANRRVALAGFRLADSLRDLFSWK